MNAKVKHYSPIIRRNRKWRNENKMLERWFQRNRIFTDESKETKEFYRLLAHGAALETIGKALEMASKSNKYKHGFVN